MPLVSIGGTAGPCAAFWMRTGVSFTAGASSLAAAGMRRK
jgi:hypothetical protein